MRRSIQRYINRIQVWRNPINDKDEWSFYGDGQGDFEEICNYSSKTFVLEYIEHLKYQQELAKRYIEEMGEK